MRDRISAVFADILDLEVDAIVNPAHADLQSGGGLDGMIHDAAGPELLAACRALGGCEIGDAKTTPGFRLRSRWVIHTVGPIWRGGECNEERLLASCYRRCLEEAANAKVRSIAFPGISTGLHRFPVELAARIAADTVSTFLQESSQPWLVVFACFDSASMRAYESALSQARPRG